MKTIFITSFHLLISRNILATPVLRRIHGGGVRIVILCPEKKRSFFEREFGAVATIAAVPVTRTNADAFLRYLALAGLRTASLARKRQTEMRQSGSIASLIIGHAYFRPLLRFLDRLLMPANPFAALFDAYMPSLVFATDVTSDLDVRVLEEAARRGVKTVGMVRSWDNLTSKGVMRAVPDTLVVNNDIVRAEAFKFHGIAESRVVPVGVPHYDRYFKKEAADGRFLSSMGIPDGSKVALFAPVGDRYVRENDVDIYALGQLDRYLPALWHILVRLPPADTVKKIEAGKFSSRIHLFRPGGSFGMVKNTELSRDDDDMLRAMLSRADLVVTGPSTMVIDAALYDKPVILIGFDGEENKPYLESVRRYYDYDHFAPIKESGGAPLARTVREFQTLLAGYIADPSKDRAARRRIVELECQFTDGESSARLADLLLSKLS